jgi:hypothetical protein
MRAYKKVLPILLALVVIAGCSSVPDDTAKHPKPEGKYIPAIDGAAEMKGPNQRAETLNDIASQSDLTEPQQLYLVSSLAEMRRNKPIDIGTTARMTSADTRRVLVTLLKNSATTRRTKQLVAGTLPSLNLSEDDERAVTRATM